ncbi:TPA: ATP-binding protein [Salmonella enterica subsp. enterica serovar Welikade]
MRLYHRCKPGAGGSWSKLIGDSTYADAILDRLVHESIKVELKGESMRKMQTSLTEGETKKRRANPIFINVKRCTTWR